MKMRKEFKIYFAITIGLLIFASIFDREISDILYNRTSLFFKTIYIFAEAPTYLLLTFLSVGIYNTRSRDGSMQSMLSAAVGATLASIFAFIAGNVVLYNMGLYSITFTLAVALGIYVCCYILTKLINDRHPLELRRISKLGIISFLIIISISYLLTTFFNRAPYRRLDGMVNIFENWYQLRFDFNINGFVSRSFPSLTVSFACIMIIVNFFARFLRKFSSRRVIISIAIYSWIFIVIMSQLVLGYCYLSDAMMSLVIGNIVITCCYYFIYKESKQD